MISRRNIRVKVMQTLYTLNSNEPGAYNSQTVAASILNEKLRQVLDLFTVSVLYVVRVAQYADIDARQRAAKYLVTASDKNLDVRIATNSFVSSVEGNKSFQEKVKNDKLERYVDEDLVKKIFGLLAKSAEYSVYTHAASHTSTADRAIVQYIWQQLILADEVIVSQFSDELPGWEDDSELIAMLMDNFFKSSSKVEFTRLLSTEKRDYAHELLKTVIAREEYASELIEPKLTNWDKERVAIIDLLLLRMGVCEFLYFETIPTKVTINEYIDIAKQYSTPQSGQFVNGVLDNILKDLDKEGLIRKMDRNKS
jgi:N utilization substance protein B